VEVVGVTRWFLPAEPDLLGLLDRQCDITVGGLDAFADWASGSVADEAVVRAAEHDADDARRGLLRALREAFTTPIDAEDLFALSESLDAVMNGAKNLVRESEVIGVPPDGFIAAMASELASGARHARLAFAALVDDHDGATAAADAATKSVRRVEHIYRDAMSKLLDLDELREVMGSRELYRRCSRMGDDLERVADRVWYAVVKSG
jgi:uncharacterized protein Yka (UPF0111/DUF47 family)